MQTVSANTENILYALVESEDQSGPDELHC